MPFMTPNIGLEAWDQGTDDFDHAQLANNWVAIDNHDHTPGRGLRITSPAIEDENVLTQHIAPLNITQPLLATPSVGTPQLFTHSVTKDILAEPAVYTANIANQQVTYEKLDPTVQPLGSVLLWYRKPGATNLPGGGWEICDGRPWSQITNSLGYTTGNIPDLRNAFPMGADINGVAAPSIGSTGGSNTRSFAHSHNVNPHVHGVPPHVHGIGADGNHTHQVWDALSGSYKTLETKVVQHFTESPNINVLHIPDNKLGEGNAVPLEFTGLHSHGGATIASGEFDTSASGATTDTQLSSVDMRPNFVALLFIMRVR